MSAPSDQDNTDQDLAGYLRQESPHRAEPKGVLDIPSSAPPGFSELPESEMHNPRDMRDIQKSLVERIADVDDDRRRTAVQLRKAFESHRDEIRDQRRRDHAAMLVLIGIGIILIAGTLLLFAQLLQARQELGARMAALETAGPAAGSPAAAAPVGADDIAALGARLDELERQFSDARAAAPAAAPGGNDDAAAADATGDDATGDDAIEAATEQVGELADAIESIGDRLTALEGLARSRTAAVPERDADADRQADATATAAAGEQRAAALEARLSALLDERLASVEARIDDVRNEMRAEVRADVREDVREEVGQNVRDDSRATATGAPGAEAVMQDPAAEAPADGTETMTLSSPMIVVQLAGLPSRDAVARFMGRHDALPATLYLKTDTRRGQAWYGVIHSLHPNMAAAEAALAALPTDLAELDTWLRPLTAGTRLEVLPTRP